MTKDFSLYTGKLRYRDIDFIFAFDKKELRLIPPEDKGDEIEWEWGCKPLGNGLYTDGDPIPVGVDVLIGECNETRNRIVFIPKQGATLGRYNYAVRIPLVAYVICKRDRDSIDRVSFFCPEINYIHPVNQAFTVTSSLEEYVGNGILSLRTRDFDRTTTEKQIFSVDGKEIKSYFEICWNLSFGVHEHPLQIESLLIFEFDATDDWQFIYRLWQIARNFVSFLCYRNNVFIPKIELSAPYEGEKHENFATMHLLGQDGETETDALEKGRIIKQIHISGHEGQILSDIAEGKLYLRHLPETYRLGRHIDAARFIMITAAFEWEFRRLRSKSVKIPDKIIEAQNAVLSQIYACKNKSSSEEERKIYERLEKWTRPDTLTFKIAQTGKVFSGILGAFADYLYQQHDQKLNYDEMGKRLADQRNRFAHGDLDEKFIDLSLLLGLIYLEYVVYAMQLKYYGVQDEEIRKSINELFDLGFAV